MIKTAIYTLIILLHAVVLPVGGEEVISLGDDRFSTREQTISSTLDKGEKVIINSAMGLSGTLSVVAQDSNQADFTYRKILKTSDPSEAMDYADMIEVSLESTPEGLELILQAPNPAPWGGTANSGMIEGELYLPLDCQIEINAVYFDIKIEGPFNSVRNKPSLGRLDVRGVSQDVNLITSSRGIIAKDIGGTVSLTTSNREMRIENLASRSRPAEIINENADINITNCTGAVNLKDSYGKIKLENMLFSGSDSKISGSYGPIRLEISDIENTVVNVTNSNEDIQITIPDSVSAKFVLKVGPRGKISVEGLKIQPAAVKNDQLEFITGDGKGALLVTIEGNGNIYLSGTAEKIDKGQ